MSKKSKTTYIIFRILLPPTAISLLVFGVSILVSYLLTKDGKQIYSVGFPYIFYEQFRNIGSNTYDTTWRLDRLIINLLLIWTLSVGGYFYWLKKFYNPKEK